MNRRNLIKTTLGSAAALSLPAAAQVVDYQQVTSPVIGGVKSRFAFGGQFNFGEVTLYPHLPGVGVTEFFDAIWNNIDVAKQGLSFKIKGHLVSQQSMMGVPEWVKWLGNRFENGKTFLLYEGVENYELFLQLAELHALNSQLSIICSSTSRDHKMELFADNVINFSAHEDGLASHKCELIKNRRRISGPRVKYFSQAADGQFHNVGVTEQI